MMEYPSITVKKLKVSSFPGNEGHAYVCDVYVDGKPFCSARDDASGAMVDLSPLPGVDYPKTWGGKFWDVLNEISNKIKANHPKVLYPEMGDDVGLEVDLEFKVALCVEEEGVWKHIQSYTKKGIVYIDPKTGAAMRFRSRDGLPLKVAVAQFKSDKPDWIVLNDMPREEALRAFQNPAEYLKNQKVL